MKRKQQEKRDLSLIKFLASVLIFVLVIAAFVRGSVSFSEKENCDGVVTLRKAIAWATFLCYAMEAGYPPLGNT